MMTEKELLIEAVLDQIRIDVLSEDFDSIAELLSFVPEDRLRGYLPEVTVDE